MFGFIRVAGVMNQARSHSPARWAAAASWLTAQAADSFSTVEQNVASRS
jgi:rhamnogalacturonyl hydrolase YesR